MNAVEVLPVGKEKEEFRNYVDSAAQNRVKNHYKMMRSHQTVEFVSKYVQGTKHRLRLN